MGGGEWIHGGEQWREKDRRWVLSLGQRQCSQPFHMGSLQPRGNYDLGQLPAVLRNALLTTEMNPILPPTLFL